MIIAYYFCQLIEVEMMAKTNVKRTLRFPKTDDNYLHGLWESGEYTTLNAAYTDAVKRGIRAMKREKSQNK
jgi:hypothetical protein